MLRNATSRLVAAHLALVALAAALVLGFVYWQAGGVIDAEQREVVETELRGLADDYARGGLPALAIAVDRRLAGMQTRDAVYLLTDSDGASIAGNLAAWPPTVRPGSGWVTLDLYRLDSERPTTISAVSLLLPGGERLLVGRDVAARAAFEATLLRALLTALGVMGVLALGTGWLLSRLILRRIAEIGETAGEIMGGSLERRIAVRGTGDEFDRLAETLNAMLDRIAALVRDLRTVTDSLAHDLRSPLGRLSRHLQAALDPAMEPGERQERIGRALEEAEGVLSMANALLEISRIEAGLGQDQFEEVDLAATARDVAELYQAVAEEQGQDITCSAEPSVLVQGHRQLLAQAVSNLVDNAVRHAPRGSMIRLEVRGGERPRLTVSDSGPGVPEEERDRVLQRFVRLDPSRGGGGTGLGLALVAAIAQMHRAEVELGDNRPGLVATITFPRGATAAPSRSTDAPAAVARALASERGPPEPPSRTRRGR